VSAKKLAQPVCQVFGRARFWLCSEMLRILLTHDRRRQRGSQRRWKIPGSERRRGSQMGVSRRHIRWEAHDENGWTTTVAQQPDGSFIAYVHGEGFGRVSSLESTSEDALRAARVALTILARHEACSDQCSEWQLTLWDGRQADAVTASAFMAAVTSRSAGRSGGHTAEGLLPTRGIRQPCAAVPRPRSGDRMLAGGVAQMFLAGHLIRTAHA
jgi:hypothetical protein